MKKNIVIFIVSIAIALWCVQTTAPRIAVAPVVLIAIIGMVYAVRFKLLRMIQRKEL